MDARRRLISIALSCCAVHDASAQCQVQQLVPSDGVFSTQFGNEVDVSGGFAFIGAWADSPGAVQYAGAVYVYQRTASGWAPGPKLTASDGLALDGFGHSVGLDGETAIVTAWGADDTGAWGGAAYFFERTPLGWVEVLKVTPSDAVGGEFFGRSAAIHGDTAVVGAGNGYGSAGQTGAAYVYGRTPAGWVETAKLLASDGQSADQFGWSSDVSGDVICVGAPDADAPGQREGAAYVFARSGSMWVEEARLTPTSSAHYRNYGWSASVDGTRVAVGAHSSLTGGVSRGAVYVFERAATSGWSEAARLVSADPRVVGFGLEVELVRDQLLVSGSIVPAPNEGSEAAYLLELGSGGWEETARFHAPGGQNGDFFGRGLALSDGTAWVGAELTDGVDSAVGAAHLFSLPQAFATAYCHCDASAPCANEDPSAGCANSTLLGTQIDACGSNSVSADDLELHVSKLPPFEFARVCMAPQQDQVAFGSGFQCLGGGVLGVFSFPVRQIAADGLVVEGPGIAAYSLASFASVGHITAGSTWNFQGWYRDRLGSCAQLGSSNAVSILFAP